LRLTRLSGSPLLRPRVASVARRVDAQVGLGTALARFGGQRAGAPERWFRLGVAAGGNLLRAQRGEPLLDQPRLLRHQRRALGGVSRLCRRPGGMGPAAPIARATHRKAQ
jgi:hypothetical protein